VATAELKKNIESHDFTASEYPRMLYML